jgi:hypothetical protein
LQCSSCQAWQPNFSKQDTQWQQADAVAAAASSSLLLKVMISAAWLSAAPFLLQLLGLQVKRAEISELLAEVDSDGSGEVEYPEFIEIMTSTLAKLAEKKEEEGSAGNQVGCYVRFDD